MADEPSTMVGGATKVATSVVGAMASSPLAIALLIVNAGFLVFAAYVLGAVATNASERNRTQMTLIEQLVKDCLASTHSAPKTNYRIPQACLTPEDILLRVPR
jgi:hypothetical protein